MGIMVLPTQAYSLRISKQPAAFSVLSFGGQEDISKPYWLVIEFTCARAGLPIADVLGKRAKFSVEPVDPNAGLAAELAARLVKPPERLISGVITEFDELSSSADETRYSVKLEARLSDLGSEVASRLFQNQTVPAVIESTLRHYGYTAVDFKFQLRAEYETHEYITQYAESALAFIQRIAAEEGIWFRFEQTPEHEVIVFGDDLDAYARDPKLSAPYREEGGFASRGADSVMTLVERRKRVVQSITVDDYNHRTAGVALLTKVNTARDDETTVGNQYRWGEHYTTPETGKRVATLRHQAELAQQVIFEGTGNVIGMTPGAVFRFTNRELGNAEHGLPTVNAPYSTGFALVRHRMEYPRGQKLAFFSLYMHLQSVEEYEKDSALKKPAYWDLAYEILDSAVDRPEANANTGIAAPEQQVGLRVRAAPRRGQILAILPQGTRLRIGEKKEKDLWGKIVEIESGGEVYPPQAGAYVADDAKTGWIFLGKEHGKPVVKQVLSDAQLDRVVILPKPFPINAGDLIGHLGQYDLLSPPTAGNRMVHIEVLCDEEIESYLKQSRTYVDQHAKDEDHTIVRVDKQVKLYKKMDQEGISAPETGVVQIYPVSVLAAAKKEDQAQETVAGSDGRKAHWWMIDSADVRHAPIEGWVRETNHAGGRVTLEAPHQWVDFKTLEEAHDPTHTMFASAQGWIDYKLDAPVPEVAALAKLSPAANEIYRAAYPTGSGAQAADELRKASKNKWRQLILSRLIVRHESEWANPTKWDSLFAQVEERTAHDPALDEEKKRIAKLVWWSDVEAGKIEGFPSSPEVFHIHPIGLLGNFVGKPGYFCRECRVDLMVTSDMMREIFPTISPDNANGFAPELNIAFEKYEINTCHRVAHFFGQCAVECGGFTAFAESLYYKDGSRLWRTYHSALVRGLHRLHPAWSEAQMEKYSKTELVKNDQGLGLVLFGDSDQPDVDYRGRGLLHLTWMENYRKYKSHSGIDIVKDPLSVQFDKHIATDSSTWYWSQWGINAVADENKIVKVTAKINPALKDIGRRKEAVKAAFRVINKESQLCKQRWESTLDQVHGW